MQPDAVRTELPSFLDRTREERAAESATDEARYEAEVSELDFSIPATAQLEVARALVVDEELPDEDVRRGDVRGQRGVVPRETVTPVPRCANCLVQPPVIDNRTRIAAHDARIRGQWRGGVQVARTVQLEICSNDFHEVRR